MRDLSIAMLSVAVLAVASAIAGDRPAARYRGHTESVQHIAYDPTGKYLASAAREGGVKLYDLAAGKSVRTLSPRGRTVSGNALASSYGAERTEAVVFSPDGKQLVEVASLRGGEGALRFWDVETGDLDRQLLENMRNVRAAAYSPDGERIAVNYRNPEHLGHRIAVLNAETGKVEFELAEPGLAASMLAFSFDGKWLASAGGRTIQFWDLEKRSLAHTIKNAHKQETVQAIEFCPKRTELASVANVVRLWDPEKGTQIRRIDPKHGKDTKTNRGGVQDIAWSHDGEYIATAGRDHNVHVVMARRHLRVAELWGLVDQAFCVAFSPDDKRIAAGGKDSSIAFWDFKPDVPDDDDDDANDPNRPQAPKNDGEG